MRRIAKHFVAVLSLVFFLGFAGYLVRGSGLQAPSSGTWVPTPGPMAEARTGAASAALPDGRVLVSGGAGASGALASAELFNPDGSFSPAAPMLAARSGHTAVALKDGRVLVAGGVDAAESPTSSAEIYDPSAGSWSPAGAMLLPRSGHTATLLDDGRVLIAGGETGSGPTQSLEIFDPASESFVLASEALLSPRMNHAAARRSDGRVLIVGGSDGTNVLASAEVFDPASEIVLPAAGLSLARAGHTATALLDGKVLVAGGNNGAQDLSSAEIYDAAEDMFVIAPSALSAPRSGHLAFLLPHNNSLLIVGGSSGGAAVSAAELYVPWTGDFTATGSLAAARSGATGSPAIADGMLLVAGGSDGAAKLSSGEVYGFATLKTDKDDYAPGETVTITGSGWEPRDDVYLVLHETLNPEPHADAFWVVTADDAGNLFDTSFQPAAHDVGVRFYLTATGARSQAQTTFTDNIKVVVTRTGSQNISVSSGGTFTAGFQIANNNTNPDAGNPISGTYSLSLPAGFSLVSGSTSGLFTNLTTSSIVNFNVQAPTVRNPTN